MTSDAQRIGAEFAAQMMGGVVDYGPPPADSMLAWMRANPQATHAERVAEHRRRGVDWDKLLRGELLDPM